MYPAAPPPPDESPAPRESLWLPIAATGVLTLATTLLGLMPLPRPAWSPSMAEILARMPWQVWLLVTGTALGCVVLAVLLTRRGIDLRQSRKTTLLWVGLLLIAAAALVWSALYDAALSTIDFGAVIPIFHWLFTFAPAVLAGLIFSRHGRRTCWWAALGTGVETVPLFALSWALMGPAGVSVAGLLTTLLPTAILAAAPLAGGVALAGALAQQPHRPAPSPYPPPR